MRTAAVTASISASPRTGYGGKGVRRTGVPPSMARSDISSFSSSTAARAPRPSRSRSDLCIVNSGPVVPKGSVIRSPPAIPLHSWHCGLLGDDGRDERANLDGRTVGAFGGMHRHPWRPSDGQGKCSPGFNSPRALAWTKVVSSGRASRFRRWVGIPIDGRMPSRGDSL